MRIWDLPPKNLCRQHLLGEHRELHALWIIITQHKKAYSHHPETLRWVGKLKALYLRHEALVKEMKTRGYKHHSPLDPALATGIAVQDEFVYSYEAQLQTLKEKGCSCRVKEMKMEKES
ncbi:MAG: pyrimidine dimer DNA glycosylase/endonuclease V [Methanosarcinaceae archaeon]|nr:pyrimidine dimer DNA glycosylase/endonuclease V [Methanosarcinaceae archaeon]MDD4749193.1 pyrimidine dimer DNA glycosylase/endonuclease V [Methanosarcinaceae archaeon]